ncbi:MAG: ribonuclease, partial [Alphaproteobacteria bacterium]|nr:ribonuclease [Alphaproteobacteria bacterium]
MKRPHSQSPLPSKDDLVAFIGQQPGKVGTREIARAFDLRNADRAALKTMLRELADEGRVEQRRKKLHHPGTLPHVVVADVTARDRDGELIAVPTEWDEAEHGPAPKIRIRIPRRPRPNEVAGIGDRVLLRVEDSGDKDEAVHHTGRIIKLIDRGKQRVLGIFRAAPGGGGRLEPIDKKQLGRELAIPPGAGGDARDGDLVAVEVAARRSGYGLANARVTERLGSLKTERAVSLIAIHAHSIPNVFPAPTVAEAEAAKPARLAGREDWRELPLITIDPADAKDHDDAVHAMRDDDPKNPGGFVISVAIADVAHYVRPGSALDREALVRGNSVYFPDQVVPMLPERISNDLCSLRPGEDRAALAVRVVVGADGRKRSHSFHRVLMRSAAKLSYVQAQAAVDGWPDETTGPLLASILEPLGDHHAIHGAVRLEQDLSLGQIQIERRALVAGALERGVGLVERRDDEREQRLGGVVGAAVEGGLHLRVVQLGEGADQHPVEAVLALAAVGADHHAHRDRRAVDAGFERAQVVGDALRQHRHDAIGE